MARENPRRIRLRAITKLLLVFGLLLLAIPFVTSIPLFPGGDTGRAAPWERLHDVRGLAPGELLRLEGPAGTVWVLRRDPEQVTALVAQPGNLRDPDSEDSEQPGAARNPWRGLDPEFFVFIPRETRRQCQVRPAVATARWPAGFDEACEGARFDLSGRIFKDTGHPEQRNLTVPPHHFPAPGQLQLLPP